MIVDDGVIVEIVRPGTGDPLPEAMSARSWSRVQPRLPLIRFGTGDMSAVLSGGARAGAPHAHQGLDGPRDSAPRCRGMFVDPSRSPRSPGSIQAWPSAPVIDWVDQADVMTSRPRRHHRRRSEKAMEGTIRTVCKVGAMSSSPGPAAFPTT